MMTRQVAAEADVVVVGGGGAGLSAALEVARAGRQVVLLEKMPQLTGTTGRSVGSITATLTPLQAKTGVQDSPDEHFEDMALFADLAQPEAARSDNLDLRRVLVDNVPDTIRELMDLGVVFFGPMPEPPHRKPRMHNVLPHSRSYLFHLSRACRKAGVDIRLNTRATHLVTEGRRVVGVDAEQASRALRFGARRGVVMAAGDYSASREVKARFIGEEMAGVEGINPNSKGEGQLLAMGVGAEVVMGQVMLGPEIRFVAPPRKKIVDLLPPVKPVAQLMKLSMSLLPGWLLRPFLMMFVTTNLAPAHKLFEEGAILVNKDGERFVDERHEPQLAIPKQPDRIAYILMDDVVGRRFHAWPNFISTAPGVAYAYLPDYRRNRKDIYASGRSVEELAGKVGIPADALQNSIDDYNATRPEGRPAIERPPFHALGPAKSWIVLTDGGLKVTTQLEALDKNGAVIPGLYAAGSNGQGGLLLEGHGHHLGWALTSGRLAGGYAARNAPVGAQDGAEPTPERVVAAG